MKPNYTKLTFILLGIFYIALAVFFLYSCSASYHFGRFIKKGGTIDTTERVVTVEKTIKVNGKDSIILFEIPLKCQEVQIPPTRQEIRYKYKLQRDSVKTYRYAVKWKTKEVVKVAKSESKAKTNWILLLVGWGLGLLTVALLKRL